jgi:hypothetical protein
VKTFDEVLSEEEQQMFLSLPCNRLLSADEFAGETLGILQEEGVHNTTTEAQRIRLKHMMRVLEMNDIYFSEGSGVFLTASYMGHSCIPNCAVTLDKDGMLVCRAVQHIHAGERLTRMYSVAPDEGSIPERRYELLATHGFISHCPRCDAPGDDTRQFNCFDPQCKGVHRVHQPLSDKPLPYRELAYTGVTYVKPHLLPCTVCLRSPPASYQTPMLIDFHPIRHHILGTQIAACQFHICQGRWLYNITVHGGYPVAEELPFLRQLMQLVSQLDTQVLRE